MTLQMLFSKNLFKNQFRHLNFYSLPSSILFVLRKRLNFISLIISFISFTLFTLI